MREIDLDSVRDDLRAALRGLRRARGFTVAAVLTLALGIAGATVMFGLIRGVLLRPLPVHEQDRLVVAWKTASDSGSAIYPFGASHIERLAEASGLLDGAAGVTRNGVGRMVVVDDGGAAEYANVALVTGGFFDVLGVRPLAGRAFTASDDRDNTAHAVVISHGYWQRRYGGAREALGRQVRIDDRAFAIAGVMPPDLDYPAGVEIWRTTSSMPANGPFGDAARREVNLVGRLRSGVTLTQAASEIGALSRRLDADLPAGAPRGMVTVMRPFTDVVVGEARFTLLALAAAVGLLLAIAGANVANLLLMRGEARRSELALRAALGAGRARIVRQVLAESLVLALMAGAVGVALAWWSLPALVALAPDGLPRAEAIRIDAAVLLFSAAVACLTALAAGLVPALSSVRGDLVAPLRGGPASPGAAPARGRRALVVAQVALAVTVIAGAGLLVRSVLRLHAIDLGLPADRLVLLDLHVPPEKHADRRRHGQWLDAAVERLEAVPAIAAATPVNVHPFLDRGWDVPRITAEGQDDARAMGNPSLNLESVHPNYFAALQIPIARGRAFTAADREGTPAVAVVSEDAAARLWPGQNPVGRRLKFGRADSPAGWMTVVGVAAGTRYRTLTASRPTLYLPAAQFQMTATNLVVRTSAPLELLTTVAADRLREIDPGVRVMRVVPFAELRDRPLAPPRFSAFLLGLFGASALLLSSVGLYAVLAAHVRQREREIAVRLALGATPGGVGRMVVAETTRLAGLGAAIGFVAAAIAGRLLRGMLFEIDPLDPATSGAVALLLVMGAALASYLPVRRATRVDATAMLRAQ
jgi:putative ABC transport system permease protein